VNGDIPMDNYESVAENYYNETYGGNKWYYTQKNK
jgi:hypothetical protein